MREKEKTKESREDQDQAQGGDPDRKRITPVVIQQKEFRLALRGYNERDVDQFLDEVTEEVARLHEENKRLREDMGTQGTAVIDTTAASEADTILRDAREEAARIVAEAESKVSEISAAAAASLQAGPRAPESGSWQSSKAFVNVFLAREREFLQSLAGLIQGHAESVKEDIRISREQSRAPSPGPPSPASAPGPVGLSQAAPGNVAPATPGGGPGGSGGASGVASPVPGGPRTQPWRPPGDGPETTAAGQGSPGSGGGVSASAEQQRERPAGGVAIGTIAPDSNPVRLEQRADGEPVLDLTKVEETPSPAETPLPPEETASQPVASSSDGTVPVQSAGAARAEDSEPARKREEPSDRSLRELFWGED
jgi:cell division initiation protein